MAKRPHNLADEYMAEEFDFGGELLPRSEIIRQLREAGWTERQIDYYQIGMEKRKELDQEQRNST